jgi:hypothetical protein
MEQTIFSGIDFNKIAFNPDFKEDSVREFSFVFISFFFFILPVVRKKQSR